MRLFRRAKYVKIFDFNVDRRLVDEVMRRAVAAEPGILPTESAAALALCNAWRNVSVNTTAQYVLIARDVWASRHEILQGRNVQFLSRPPAAPARLSAGEAESLAVERLEQAFVRALGFGVM